MKNVLLKFTNFHDNDKKSYIRILYENKEESQINSNEYKLIKIEENEENKIKAIYKLNFQLWTSFYWGKSISIGFIKVNIGNGKFKIKPIKLIETPIIIDLVEDGIDEISGLFKFTIQLLNKTIDYNDNENKIWFSFYLISKNDSFTPASTSPVIDENYQIKLNPRENLNKSIFINNFNTEQIVLPVLKHTNRTKFASRDNVVYEIEILDSKNKTQISNGSICLKIYQNSSSYNKLYEIVSSSFKLINETTKNGTHIILTYQHSQIGSASL